MSDPAGIGLFVLVIVLLLARRLVPRALVGFDRYLDPHELRERMARDGRWRVLDVRTPREFVGDLGHVRGALNVPVHALKSALADAQHPLAALPRDVPVVAACRTDSRSARAARILQRSGFTEVFVLAGGMAAWNGDGLPVEHGTAAADEG